MERISGISMAHQDWEGISAVRGHPSHGLAAGIDPSLESSASRFVQHGGFRLHCGKIKQASLPQKDNRTEAKINDEDSEKNALH